MIFNSIVKKVGGGGSLPQKLSLDIGYASKPKSITFTGLTKEPSWFALLCCGRQSSVTDYPVVAMVYDGTATTFWYSGNNYNTVTENTTYGSFSYNSGILTLTISNDIACHFGGSYDDYYLYYL